MPYLIAHAATRLPEDRHNVAFLPKDRHREPLRARSHRKVEGLMRRLAWVLVPLGLLVIALFWLELASHRQPSPDCSGGIVIVPGPRGMPMECVCDEGRLATCFNPGP